MRLLLAVPAMVLAVGILAGCGPHQPLQDKPDKHGEIPSGPGVFTGSDGGWYLLGGPEKKKRSDLY